MTAVEQLKTLSDVVTSKKHRMDSRQRDAAVKLIQEIWASPEGQPEETLNFLDAFAPEPIAEGVGAAWNSMGEEPKRLFLDWVSGANDKRAMLRIVYAAVVLLNHDSHTSTKLLSVLAPPGSTNISKNTLSAVGRVFFGKSPVPIDALIAPTNPGVSPEICDLLLNAALNADVGQAGRFQIARLILKYLASAGHHTSKEGLRLTEQIALDTKQWHSEFRDRLRLILRDLDSTLLSYVFPEQPSRPSEINPMPDATSSAQQQAVQGNSPALVCDTRPDYNLLEHLDEKIAAVEEEGQFLEVIRSTLTRGQHELAAINSTLAEKDRSNEELHRRLKQTTLLEQRLRDELGEAQRRIDRLEGDLAARKDESHSQRAALLERVERNAKGVLNEFQNSVAMRVGPLVSDVVGTNAEHSPELSKVLLIRIRQLVKELEKKGIRLDSPKGGAS